MKSIFDSAIVSSRIRLARNIAELAYPRDDGYVEGNLTFLREVTNVVRKSGKYKIMLMSQLTPLQKQAMIERHLISPLLAKNTECGAVMLSMDDSISIMLNEEDHIRSQCVLEGFDLVTAFDKLNQIDNMLIANLPIAFDKKLGFLTACPTNVGTGMRASLMMFLPALTKTNGIGKVVSDLAKAQIEVRGMWGEGSKPNACMYQISNRLSLGFSEYNLINAVIRAGISLAVAEANAREQLIESDFVSVKDTAMRSLGLINYAYKLSMDELFDCYANIKLGEYYEFFAISNMQKFDEILPLCAEGNLLQNNDTRQNVEVVRAKQAKKFVAQLCKVI